VMVAITEGRLDFGPWEQIFYGEFDGAARSACWLRLLANKHISLTLNCKAAEEGIVVGVLPVARWLGSIGL